MPELPEIETVKRCVGPLLEGRTITSIDVSHRGLVAHPSFESFVKGLAGRRVVSLSRRGKFLIWHLDDGAHVTIHFRMSGQMTVSPPERGPMRFTRFTAVLGDGSILRYADQRKFGRMWLFAKGEEDTSGVGALGPEPDDPSLDWRYLRDSLGGRRIAIKTGLLDQSVVAGLGNIYADEVLFATKVNPLEPCNEVTVPQWKRIARQIPKTIEWAVGCGSMTRDEYLETGGKGYRDSVNLKAYGREGEPCSRCGAPMVRSAVGGRSACWCPICQKLRRCPDRSFIIAKGMGDPIMSADSRGIQFLKRPVGPITVVQVLAIAISATIGLIILSLEGMGRSLLGWLLVAVIIYIVPHFAGAGVRTKAVFGIMFALIGVIAGGFAVGPSYVDDVSANPADGEVFTDIRYEYGDGGRITVTAGYSYSGEGEPYLAYTDISMVSFRGIYTPNEIRHEPLTVGGSTATATINVDDAKLWFLALSVDAVDANGDHEIVGGTVSQWAVSGDAYEGSLQIYVLGAAFCMMYIAVIFYIVLVFSALIRRTINGKRGRLENSGRLYPQGYGRCARCGAVVLPGEVECRKCGAYIDRPESMKPRKVDYFECSGCGAEVPADAEVCPKCGARFDGVENEVEHADGTVDTSLSSFKCPDCDYSVPENSRLCPKCGHRFP